MRDKAKREVKPNHNFCPHPLLAHKLQTSRKPPLRFCECISNHCWSLGWTKGKCGGSVFGVKGSE